MSCVPPAADLSVAQWTVSRLGPFEGRDGAEEAWALEQEGRFQIPQLPLPSVVTLGS